MESETAVCCGRPMRAIGLQRADGVQLGSCTECGRHAWRAQGKELSREQLLAMLGEAAPTAGTAGAAAPTQPVGKEPTTSGQMTVGQRAELQELLRGFTAHGSSS